MTHYAKGVLYIIMAYFSYSIMSVFVKLASSTLVASEILFARFIVGTVLIAPFIFKKKNQTLKINNIPFFVIRNVAGIGSMLLMFYAIREIPVSLSILLMNTAALFVPLIVLLLFKTKTKVSSLICVIVGFIGVAVIVQVNTNQDVSFFYLLLGIGSAILAAIVYCSLQELNKSNSPQNIVFYFHLTGSIVLPLFFFNYWTAPSLYELLLLFLVGLFGIIYQIFLTQSFKFATATEVTPFTFTGVIFSSLCDWFIWNDFPSLNFWIGAVIIIGSISYLAKLDSK
ncbi:DMT family transporter [Phocoenobacter skyensis]|uniref:DMT family transporter n=1 Tax=Phocoenobacter skyensis TaxID=97481 RepID=A0A1H7XXG5_9PAST|nr:DMT family transporter [Pasteurella skyensis]MDP8079810.1 DMT family transporter [Pasteurella skyensis]MDP8085721.1 DMT family transporter [Pasteurella skyensis]MDP8161880.1 DMT family transporter [Pasteurella skyensis]MDP8171186.1 DMT family transporter [Pasteurella skyensis]MDP8172036.1 DMT family transporter [Pasteurella skyensis]